MVRSKIFHGRAWKDIRIIVAQDFSPLSDQAGALAADLRRDGFVFIGADEMRTLLPVEATAGFAAFAGAFAGLAAGFLGAGLGFGGGFSSLSSFFLPPRVWRFGAGAGAAAAALRLELRVMRSTITR